MQQSAVWIDQHVDGSWQWFECFGGHLQGEARAWERASRPAEADTHDRNPNHWYLRGRGGQERHEVKEVFGHDCSRQEQSWQRMLPYVPGQKGIEHSQSKQYLGSIITSEWKASIFLAITDMPFVLQSHLLGTPVLFGHIGRSVDMGMGIDTGNMGMVQDLMSCSQSCCCLHWMLQLFFPFTLILNPLPLRAPDQQVLFSAPGFKSTSSPATPHSLPAPATPTSVVESSGGDGSDENKKEKNKNKTNKDKKVEPLTPLTRGRDLEKQILAKKSECSNLTTQIKTLDFGHGLAAELGKFGDAFEWLDCSLAVVVMNDDAFLHCLFCEEPLHDCPQADCGWCGCGGGLSSTCSIFPEVE